MSALGSSTLADIAALSSANYRRHRVLRYVSALAGFALFGLLVGLGAWGLYHDTPNLFFATRVFILACSIFLGYLCVMVAWIPFRYFGPSPVGMSVDSRGLEFSDSRGRRKFVSWSSGALHLELLARTLSEGRPNEAAFRLWFIPTRGDLYCIWRRLVPLTYLPGQLFEQVLAQAASAHLSIERVENARSGSLVPTLSRTAFLITTGE